MVKRKIFASPMAFLSILASSPALLQIRSFNAFSQSAGKSSSGCNCHKQENLKQLKSQFEAAFGAMSDEDRANVKKILNVEEVCYYVSTSQGLLVMRCF